MGVEWTDLRIGGWADGSGGPRGGVKLEPCLVSADSTAMIDQMDEHFDCDDCDGPE